MQIIVKNYNHINKAFGNWDTPEGKLVKSKDHYDRLMKEGGYVVAEEGIDRNKNRDGKAYKLSKEAWEIIKTAKNHVGKNGKIGHLPGRTIEAMKKMGAINKNIPNYMKLPTAYTNKGGFD